MRRKGCNVKRQMCEPCPPYAWSREAKEGSGSLAVVLRSMGLTWGFSIKLLLLPSYMLGCWTAFVSPSE